MNKVRHCEQSEAISFFKDCFVVLLFTTTLLTSAKGDVMASTTQWEKATFAGGCFWCMQPFFDNTKGVKKTTVGYTGGQMPNPSYEEVSSGATGQNSILQ